MIIKNQIPKIFLGCLFFFLCLFALSSCSTMKNWFSFSSDPNNVKTAGQLDENDLKQFATSVIPVKGNADNQYKLARYFQKQGRNEIAVEEFIKVLKIDPQHYNAYNALGVSYDRLKEYDLAVDAYRAALKLNPSLDYVYNNLGYSNLLKGDFQEAALAFEQAIALNDQNKTYQNNLSLVQAKLGNDVQVQAATEIPAEPAPVLSQDTKIEPNEKNESAEQQTLAVDDASADKASNDEIAEEPSVQSKIEKTFYAVQLGAYTDISKARNHLKKAFEKGYDCPYMIKVDRGSSYKPYYRVRFGKFTNKRDADSLGAAIIDQNGKQAYAITENYPINVFGKDSQEICTDMETQPRLVNKEYSIEISNGNGVNLMARRVGNYLSRKGYNVKKISNASNFNHPQTTIYYNPGFYDQAQKLTQQIPGFEKTGRLVESNQIKKNIEVLIGKDIIPYAQDFKKTQKNS